MNTPLPSIETEISVHALELKMPVGEVETLYAARPEGSQLNLRACGPRTVNLVRENSVWRCATLFATAFMALI